jgi:hypothetical protein
MHKESFPPDTTLHEELMAVADDDVVEMTNLFTADTGIEGVIFVSTEMASHGPRVKYSQKPGRHQPSFSVSISQKPRVVANSLPDRIVAKMAPPVIAWVELNRSALLDFWNNGTTLSHEEVSDFIAHLVKLPRA